MKSRKCMNKKCQRPLPEGYKHKYCENCRNEHVKKIKDVGKGAVPVGLFLISIVTKGRINIKK